MPYNVRNKKTGMFVTAIDDGLLKYLIEHIKKETLFEDVMKDVRNRYALKDDRTITKAIIKAQKIEMYMRKGLTYEQAKSM